MKLSNRFMVTYPSIGGIKTCYYSMRLQKEEQTETTNKNSLKTCKKHNEDVKPYFVPQNKFDCASFEK